MKILGSRMILVRPLKATFNNKKKKGVLLVDLESLKACIKRCMEQARYNIIYVEDAYTEYYINGCIDTYALIIRYIDVLLKNE